MGGKVLKSYLLVYPSSHTKKLLLEGILKITYYMIIWRNIVCLLEKNTGLYFLGDSQTIGIPAFGNP